MIRSDSSEGLQYFDYDKKSYKIAKAAALKLPTEGKVLEYLVEAKPRFLNPADSMLGMDAQQLHKLVYGVADKLTIHCYPERGDRLRYLYDILATKLSGNEDCLKMIMIFLLEMSERPTSLLRLDVEDAKYSEKPDHYISEENSISEREILKLILEDAFESDALVSYSSESELSSWSDDDENEQSNASSNGIVAAVTNVKPSQSFSDFTAIQLPTDDETKLKEMTEYWNLEAAKAKEFWSSQETHSSCLTPLCRQPVIPGLLALHSKFGEYWEWKHASGHQSERLIILEEVLLQEIMWQFSILSPESSQIFNSDWNLKPGLMTSCLSCESLSSCMLPVLQTLSALSTFKKYVQQAYANSTIINATSSTSTPSVPPILLSYAHGLSDILNFVSEMVQKVESNISARKNKISIDQQPCSTLIQLINRIRPYMDVIETLSVVHKNNFQDLHNVFPENDATGSCCLTLLHNLFTTLTVQRDPMKFGFVMFLFSKCLRAFLDEINASLTLNWSDHLLFSRFPDSNISDHNFWQECIKRRDYEDDLKPEHGIFSISFFRDLIEEMLIVLKTSEMIRQLDADCVKIIGFPPDSKTIVDDFFKMMFPFLEEEEQHQNFLCPSVVQEEPNLPELDLVPEYEKHFRFLGLEDSLEADSVKLILQELTMPQTVVNHYGGGDSTISSSACNLLNNNDKWLFNLAIQHMPKISVWHALETTLTKWYNPLSSKANLCIHQIFADYSVDQSLQLFREIILETREDFAQSIIDIVARTVKSTPSRYKLTGPSCRNPAFQKLLADCYPEGRDNFDIELKLDRTFDTNYTLIVKPHFPLNLVLFEDSIDSYLFVARQLSRIRKSLWQINALSIKDIKSIEGVEPNRMLLFRFAFLHFCSSLRAYLVFKVFVKDVRFCTGSPTDDLDLIRRVHGGHLKTIEIELLRNPLIEKVILRKMGDMSALLTEIWHVGIPSRSMVLLEDTLKKCWSAILTFRRNSSDFNELAYHFGPIPSYL